MFMYLMNLSLFLNIILFSIVEPLRSLTLTNGYLISLSYTFPSLTLHFTFTYLHLTQHIILNHEGYHHIIADTPMRGSSYHCILTLLGRPSHHYIRTPMRGSSYHCIIIPNGRAITPLHFYLNGRAIISIVLSPKMGGPSYHYILTSMGGPSYHCVLTPMGGSSSLRHLSLLFLLILLHYLLIFSNEIFTS